MRDVPTYVVTAFAAGDLAVLEQAAANVTSHERAADVLRAHRDRYVAAALGAGVPVAAVARAAGVSRMQVHRIAESQSEGPTPPDGL